MSARVDMLQYCLFSALEIPHVTNYFLRTKGTIYIFFLSICYEISFNGATTEKLAKKSKTSSAGR